MGPRMHAKVLLFILLLVAGPLGAAPPRTTLFSVGDLPATRGVVTAHWATPPSGEVPSSDMLRTLTGVGVELGPRQIRDLERALSDRTRVPPDVRVVESLWTVHLWNGSAKARVEIGRVEEGWILASRDEREARLEQVPFEHLSQQWGNPRPDPTTLGIARRSAAPDHAIDDPAEREPTLLRPQPRASPVRLDAPELSKRFARGGVSPFEAPLTRDIDGESFNLYIPPDAKPNRPLGLLVWINPTESPEPPSVVTEAAGALGLAVIPPAHAGNDRPVVDRLQLALDAVQTATNSVWIDADRVYIAGMSGGGRLASMLWAGAPDVFTGALGIVGLNSHHQIPTGKGTVWPPSHRLPAGDLARRLRPHPIAAITGPRDFNFVESRQRITQLKREGFEARLFDLPRLAHEMPDAGTIRDALIWIDRPVQQQRSEAGARADTILDRIPPEVLENPESPLSEQHRRALVRVTELAPWTEPAWFAAERLGYTAIPPGAP